MNKTKTEQEAGQFDTPSDPFQVFEDLAHKLANVPKEEIDKIDPLVQKKKKPKSAKKS